PLKGWQVGRAANSLSTQSLLDRGLLRSSRIVKAQFGLVGTRFPPGGSARSTMAASSATERTAVLAVECLICMRTGGETSGRQVRTGYGDGNLVRQNSFPCQVCCPAKKILLKTLTARC